MSRCLLGFESGGVDAVMEDFLEGGDGSKRLVRWAKARRGSEIADIVKFSWVVSGIVVIDATRLQTQQKRDGTCVVNIFLTFMAIKTETRGILLGLHKTDY